MDTLILQLLVKFKNEIIIGFSSFLLGASIVSLLSKDCTNYIEDINTLEKQVRESNKKCLEKIVKKSNETRKKEKQKCEKKINDLSDSVNFDPNLHCPICNARGFCK